MTNNRKCYLETWSYVIVIILSSKMSTLLKNANSGKSKII